MDLKKLKYLDAVYRLGNISAAANEQFVSQPAMSKAIHLLEEELGTELITRTARGVVFTENGELFMGHVRQILKAVKDAEREIQDLNDRTARKITIGLSNTALVWLLPLIYSDFKKEHPNFTVNVEENTQEAMMRGLLTDELDLIFSIIPHTGLPDKLTAVTIMTGEIRLVLPEKHPLAIKYKNYIPFFELSNVVLFSYPRGSLIRSLIETKCSEHNIPVRLINASNQLHTNYDLAMKGAGLSHMVCDCMTPDIDFPGLVTRSFEEPLYLEEGIVTKKGHYQNRAARELTRYIRNLVS
ncbi:MAG: LysR family transcriptional regulator [Lachnospiraceae bacterium]|nr:LysR family transcriptional regulator [Lachnospiraceae bacterium]